jgi:hypothetical protein
MRLSRPPRLLAGRTDERSFSASAILSRKRMQGELTLRFPTEDEEHELLSAHRATSPDVPYFLHYYEQGMPLRRFLEVLSEQQRGINLPPNLGCGLA